MARKPLKILFLGLLIFSINSAFAATFATREDLLLGVFGAPGTYVGIKKIITPADRKTIAGSGGGGEVPLIFEYFRAVDPGAGKGFLVFDRVWGKHQFIDFALRVDAHFTIEFVEILAYREAYGGQVAGALFRNQFKGKSLAHPIALNHDIRNISQATISCRALTMGVRRALATLKVFEAPREKKTSSGGPGS